MTNPALITLGKPSYRRAGNRGLILDRSAIPERAGLRWRRIDAIGCGRHCPSSLGKENSAICISGLPDDADRLPLLFTGSSNACIDAGSQPFENCGNALTATDAHRHESITASDTVQFVDGLHRNDCASCSHWVAKRDAGPVGVDLGRVEV